MAICQDCQHEMHTAASCTVDVLILGGERFERHRLEQPVGPAGRCGDCGIQRGGYHHLGCDLEDCPSCGHQLISCGCVRTNEDIELLVGVADGTVVYPEGLRGLAVSDQRYPFGEPGTDRPWPSC